MNHFTGRIFDRLGQNIIILGLLVGVFYTDLITPLGFAHGILYLPVVIFAVLRARVGDGFHKAVLALAVVGVIVGYFSAPNATDLPEFYIISNRLLSVAILLLSYAYCRKLRVLAQQNVEISKLEQAQRQTLENFIDAMPVQVWLANPSGELDYASGSLTVFTGKSREVVVADWTTLIHPDDIENTLATWQHSVQTGELYHVDFRLQRHDGEYVWHQTQAIPQRDDNGQIQRWIGSSSDIDDLLRFREESERLAMQFRHTVESITDAFFTLDHDFRFTYLNHKAAEALGSSIEELLGNVIWEKCGIGYQSAFAMQYRKAAQTQSKLHFEEFYSPADKWLEVHIYPSPDGLTIYFSDITEQREKRERLLLLNTAVSRLNDIIIITEAEPLNEPGPRILYVNDAFEAVTGYSSAEVIGKSPRLLQGPKTDRQELQRIKEALQQRQSVRAQLINYTKSGKEYWLEMEIVPLIDNDGHCTHLVSVERDITERMEMEQRLRESQKLEAVGHLTGGVAHDFNNLLTVIMGNSEMLADQIVDPEQRAMAEMTVSAARRGAELTSRLLAFARRQPLDPKPTDLNHQVTSMKPLIRRTLSENIELEFVPDPQLGITEIDAGELDTALLNLVVNARDAMQYGGKLTIETANTVLDRHYASHHPEVVPGEYVMICVSDTGVGMGNETVHRAFEPFFTTKDVGKGSGLGLSMVFGFTKQSGGHVNIYSEIGEGTSVKLYFPKAKSAPRLVVPAKTKTPLLGGNEHILIAEDDDLVLQHLENQLHLLGYRVTAVISGPDALEALKAHDDIDLLLTDIIMPGGMNGRELADQARVAYPLLKVLFTSGYSENAIIHHGRLDPGVALLSKPYTRLELATKVRRVLDKDVQDDEKNA